MKIVYSEVMNPLEIKVTQTTVILFEGGFEEFFPAACADNLGRSLCSAARVNNTSERFLKKDFFLVRAEIRLKLQDNERWTVSVKRKTATCTVISTSSSSMHIVISCLQWKLKGLPSLCPSVLWSEFFNIGETKWCVRHLLALPSSGCIRDCCRRRLKLVPKGNTSNSDNIGFYLFNCQDHSVRVRTEIRAMNNKSTKKASEDKVRSRRAFSVNLHR